LLHKERKEEEEEGLESNSEIHIRDWSDKANMSNPLHVWFIDEYGFLPLCHTPPALKWIPPVQLIRQARLIWYPTQALHVAHTNSSCVSRADQTNGGFHQAGGEGEGQ